VRAIACAPSPTHGDKDGSHRHRSDQDQPTFPRAQAACARGKCAKCGPYNDGPTSDELRAIAASTDHRLESFDKAAKYGLGTQSEVVAPAEIKAEAERMMAELWQILGIEEGWPAEKVQFVVERMTGSCNTSNEGRELELVACVAPPVHYHMHGRQGKSVNRSPASKPFCAKISR